MDEYAYPLLTNMIILLSLISWPLHLANRYCVRPKGF